MKGRQHLLIAAALMGLSAGLPALPAPIPREPRRDPHKPKTRYRRAAASPAKRLMERQRQRNQPPGERQG